MRIVFFSPDYALRGNRPLFGGAPYYRCILPAKELAKHGYETYVSPTIIVHQETGYLTGQTATGEIPDPDTMVIHSWPEDGTEAILRAREAGQIVIGDIDDLMWDLPEGHQAEGLERTDNKSIENIWRNLMACSALTVSTPYLKKWIESQAMTALAGEAAAPYGCPPIYVVRNAIDLDAFTYNSMRDKVRTIGWSGNPLWRADDISLLRPWLNGFLERHHLRFMHVGALQHSSIAGQIDIDPKLLIERPFRTFEEYRPSNPLREIDIQLIPLLDCPFNRAKSALKGLESAAWGIPFIATQSDEYNEVFYKYPHLYNGGSFEDSVLEQATYLNLRRRDREIRRELQFEMTKDYNITSCWKNWADVYSELAAS